MRFCQYVQNPSRHPLAHVCTIPLQSITSGSYEQYISITSQIPPLVYFSDLKNSSTRSYVVYVDDYWAVPPSTTQIKSCCSRTKWRLSPYPFAQSTKGVLLLLCTVRKAVYSVRQIYHYAAFSHVFSFFSFSTLKLHSPLNCVMRPKLIKNRF